MGEVSGAASLVAISADLVGALRLGLLSGRADSPSDQAGAPRTEYGGSCSGSLLGRRLPRPLLCARTPGRARSRVRSGCGRARTPTLCD